MGQRNRGHSLLLLLREIRDGDDSSFPVESQRGGPSDSRVGTGEDRSLSLELVASLVLSDRGVVWVRVR
jgi:hypothetical protein